MNSTFKKLNFSGQADVFVLNAPESFQSVLDDMRDLTTLHAEVTPQHRPAFILTFTMKQAEVDAFADLLAAQTEGDAVVWVAYPKGTSKRYTCEFNRDNGWTRMGEHGFEPVRQVAIDEDWSALRFRRVQFIKTMKRGGAISEEGQKRIRSNNPGR